MKRVIVLLHKIGEGLHAAQASDHPKNATGGRLVSSFLTKLANSLQPAAAQEPPEAVPEAREDADMEEALNEEEEVCFGNTDSLHWAVARLSSFRMHQETLFFQGSFALSQ